MRFCTDPRTPLPPVRIAAIAALTLLISGWTTCSVMGALNTCTGIPKIMSITPSTVSANTESAVLTVAGTNFAPQSQIQWNGTAVPTTFVNSTTLETTITQQTFDTLGGTADSTVQISVMTTGSTAAGCSGSSAAISLVIN